MTDFFLRFSKFGHAAVPALLYAALSNTVYILAGGIGNLSGLMRQAAAMGVCFLFFAGLAVREQLAVRGLKRTVYRYPASFCYAAAVVPASVACNHLLSLTRIAQVSSGYRHVTEVFYGSSLLLEIITLCILGPLTEEIVYRGFVYQRIRKNSGNVTAAFLSALVFGVLHLNVVQGIYAFVLGLLLAYIVYKTESILTAAAAHMAANLASVLWTETDWLDILNQQGVRRFAVIGLCLILAVIFFFNGNQLMKRDSSVL